MREKAMKTFYKCGKYVKSFEIIANDYKGSQNKTDQYTYSCA